MKTALETLIEFIWENLDSNPVSIRNKATELLEKEREQIVEAHAQGARAVVGIMVEEFRGKIPLQLWNELVEIQKDNDIDDSLDYFTKTFKK